MKDGHARLTLNRPEKHNPLDGELIGALSDTLAGLAEDPALRVVTLQGAGKSFCAGADLKFFLGILEDAPALNAYIRKFKTTMAQLEHFPVPVIAVVHGYVLAGGLELALSCDIRIASENASFGCPEVRWGVLHGYGALRLPRMIPMAEAMEMLLTGDFIDAQRALRIGLVSRVVPLDQLMPTAEAIARRICENAPLSVRVTKELVHRGANMPPNEGVHMVHSMLSALYSTEDSKGGPRAFNEKRKPVYRAR